MKDTAAPPPLLMTLLEMPRALSEASMLVPSHPVLSRLPRGDGHAVMTLPGFLASDRSTGVLRDYLRRWNYAPQGWGLGRNLGLAADRDIEGMLDRRLEALYRKSGGKVSLVGWSLGGLFARELARRHPGRVRQIVTLGSPIGGNPRATNAWRLYRYLTGTGPDDPNVRLRLREVRRPVPGVPSTAIYSRTDSIVSWRIAREAESELTQNIEVKGSHIGLGFNPAVLYVIADRLSQRRDAWRPFEIDRLRRVFYK